MNQLEILVFEFGTINGNASGSISFREIASLNHESRNNPMEFGTFESQFLSRFLARGVAPAQH